MDHFVVSARKYRPKSFKDVVGQEVITNTLENAIKNNHLAQALLFTGPRGVGKTTCARILAKMINQDDTQSADESFAFNIFELDAASNNSVDDIRSLTDQIRIPPQTGKYKVYIIDEVHMLSQAAFNAFLKTLEEPPKHCIFILATTEKHKIIPTILSRCQIFDFKRISIKDTKDYLQYIAKEQGVDAEDDALHIIAQKSDGALRDALSTFDRVVSFSGNTLTRKTVTENLNVLDYEIYFKTTDYILQQDIPKLLLLFNKVLSDGFDGHHYIIGLASHFRDLLVCQTPETIDLMEVGDTIKEQYAVQSKKVSAAILMRALELANQCDLNYKASKNKRLLVELCLMQLASIPNDSEKKNTKPYIKPPESLKITNNTTSTSLPTEKTPVETPQPQKPEVNKTATEKPLIKTVKENALNTANFVSGLSLKSIKKKQEHKVKQQEVIGETEVLPQENFTESDLIEAWNTHINKMEKKGKFNLASILSIDKPKLRDNTIHLIFPNSTNKVEVEQHQGKLLQLLRKTLNNYYITLDISVDESLEKKYVYSSQEKYLKLLEKNPNIKILKDTFGLDI